MDTDQALRKHLLALLHDRQAHMMFDDVVANFPMNLINVQPPNVTYTPWHLIEHLRFTQWDILEYMRNPNYTTPRWPDEYWPPPDAQADPAMWTQTIKQFQNDLLAIEHIVSDPQTDLYAPIAHGYDGHPILREVLLVADHNAYHIGELGILRQVMNAWTGRH